MSDPRPIGVFDSGVGGLTVARAIIDLLPHEPLIYVGDSARFPYGSQPVERIRRYALEIAQYLVQRDVKLLVIACNSIEVSAIGDIAVSADIPVVGVVNPGSRAAIRATRNGVVGVIGTEATIATGAYQRAIGSAVALHTAACPAFVDYVERGDTSSPELRTVARGYLEPLMEAGVDTLVLGCTHYPLLSGLLQLELGPAVVLEEPGEKRIVGAAQHERVDPGVHEWLKIPARDGAKLRRAGIPSLDMIHERGARDRMKRDGRADRPLVRARRDGGLGADHADDPVARRPDRGA